ncbi:MAG TPA: hypothetical protein VN654_27480 [Vicinamibacterales bacterium]|nr:hypothetical protein [Vicinamibacterales bacterium]
MPMPVDFNPGAVIVDTRGEDKDRAWFVTRLAEENRKVYRFDFGPSLMKNNGNARWTSWDLTTDVVNNGGVAKLKASHDRRFLFVRTSSSIQEVDTQACPAGTPLNPTVCPSGLRRWDFSDAEAPDPDSVFVSDLTVDNGRRVFSVGRSVKFPNGYLQILIPTKVGYTSSTTPLNAPAGTVTRWRVDGVDQCQSFGMSGFCNSGIDLQPDSQNQNLIYFSDQGFEQPIGGTGTVTGSIGELNINTNQIRRWPMPLDSDGQPITEPRQMNIDNNGTVWVVTGSGHVVSLNPKNSSKCAQGKNLMTRHRIPPEALQNDGWGVAPDSHVIGYTDANNNKVGMLVPHDAGVCVAPIPETTNKMDIPSTVTTVPTAVASDVTPGIPKTVLKKTTRKQDGTYVEAVINMPAPNADPTMEPPSSLSPLGITPVKFKGESTFFYAVGMTAGANATSGPSFAKRVGFVRLGVPDRERFDKPRDDDDADDGMDRTMHPTWHISEVGDDDADSVPDQFDTPTARENMTAYPATATAPMSASPDYTVTTTGTTLALLATAQADNPTALIAVDVYNALGTLLTSSGPLAGSATASVPNPGAGTFTVRVRNLSGGPVSVTPTVVARDLLP